MMMGLIHIYEGDGKGKTTTAIGLSIRCAGSGGRVLFSQFLKDDSSSEKNILMKLENIEYRAVPENFGFVFQMTPEAKQRAKEAYNGLLISVIEAVSQGDYRMLILDEIIDAYHTDLIDQPLLLDFLKDKPEQLEVIMTGRDADELLLEQAHYVSDIRKVKHPYDCGIPARIGIEK
jgi:cob(I)alamin adenosyltransferase